jgi:hypothetical protein
MSFFKILIYRNIYIGLIIIFKSFHLHFICSRNILDSKKTLLLNLVICLYIIHLELEYNYNIKLLFIIIS